MRIGDGGHGQPVRSVIQRIKPDALAGVGARQRDAARSVGIGIGSPTGADDVRHQRTHRADRRWRVFGLDHGTHSVDEDGGVVRAGDGHAHRSAHGSAVAISERDGEGLKPGLARSEVFHIGSCYAVVPRDDSAQPRAGAVGADGGRQRTQWRRRRRRHADAVRVGQIHVGEGYRTAVGKVAHRRHQLSDRTGHIGGRHNWRVVAAVDGDGDGRADRRVVRVLDLDVILQSDRFAGSEEIKYRFRIAVSPVDSASVAKGRRGDAKPVV